MQKGIARSPGAGVAYRHTGSTTLDLRAGEGPRPLVGRALRDRAAAPRSVRAPARTAHEQRRHGRDTMREGPTRPARRSFLKAMAAGTAAVGAATGLSSCSRGTDDGKLYFWN